MLNIAGKLAGCHGLLGSYNNLAIYWPASVSDWCYSCSLHRERKHDIPRPRTVSGLGGHYRPLFHKVFTTSIFECVAYYRQMSSWFVWQAARIILSDLSHSCTGGLASLAAGASVAVMLAFTAPMLMLHTHSYKMVRPFVEE